MQKVTWRGLLTARGLLIFCHTGWLSTIHTFDKAQAQMAQPFSPWFIFGHARSHTILEAAFLTSCWFVQCAMPAIPSDGAATLLTFIFGHARSYHHTIPEVAPHIMSTFWPWLVDCLSMPHLLRWQHKVQSHTTPTHMPSRCSGRQSQQSRWQMQCHMTMQTVWMWGKVVAQERRWLFYLHLQIFFSNAQIQKPVGRNAWKPCRNYTVVKCTIKLNKPLCAPTPP